MKRPKPKFSPGDRVHGQWFGKNGTVKISHWVESIKAWEFSWTSDDAGAYLSSTEDLSPLYFEL